MNEVCTLLIYGRYEFECFGYNLGYVYISIGRYRKGGKAVGGSRVQWFAGQKHLEQEDRLGLTVHSPTCGWSMSSRGILLNRKGE